MSENNAYGFENQEVGNGYQNQNEEKEELTMTEQPYEETHRQTYPDYLPDAQPPVQPALTERKKKKSGRMGFAAAVIAICMIGSTVFGFGGTYLANNLNSANAAAAETVLTDNSGNTVLYQSVIKTSTGNSAAEKMSVEDVVANVKSSVVEITTETVSTGRFMGQYVSKGAGSGVIISKDGYIVTNNHVVDGANTITVRLSNGSEHTATLIGTDAKSDLAVIKINANDLQPAVLGYSSELLVGQSAVAIGNPLGELGGTVTSGIISALDREITIDGETMSLLQTDTAINPGNSGGGLFNLYGELVGVVNAKSSGSEIEGLGFAIPIDTAKIVIEQIIEYGYVTGRIDTGFTLIDIQDAQIAMMYRIQQLGLYILRSVSGEFQSGDRITAIDGQTISSLSDFNKQMSNYHVGDTVSITVIRNGKSVTASLTLTELKV